MIGEKFDNNYRSCEEQLSKKNQKHFKQEIRSKRLENHTPAIMRPLLGNQSLAAATRLGEQGSALLL